MARSDIVTQIPLDDAARILGIDPYHYNSLVTTRHPENSAADDIWWQHPWQRVGQLSRDDLAQALYWAEQNTAKFLGYYLIPQWIRSEEHRPEKPAVGLINQYSLNSRMQYKSIRLDYGYVLGAGVRASSLIEAGAAIVYSDEDGDGYAETATVTVTTTVTDDEEIRAFFPGEDGAEEWEIRPVRVSISAGTATIIFKRYLVPDPDLWEQDPDPGEIWRAIDGDDITNFLTTIDVYRVYHDPSTQAIFYNERSSCSICGGTGCAACNFYTESGCVAVKDERLGIVTYQRASWDEDEEGWYLVNSEYPDPDKIKVHYRAGKVNHRLNRPYTDIDPMWKQAIIYYAMSFFDRNMATSENTHNIWRYQTEDLAVASRERSFQIGVGDLTNPLGTTRGAISLWKMILQNRIA